MSKKPSKEPLVSLVSAYDESDQESDNGSDNESAATTSKHEEEEEDVNIAATTTASEEDDTASRASSRPEQQKNNVESQNEESNATDREGTASNAIQIDDEENMSRSSAREPPTTDVDRPIDCLSIENGFPPGCEQIRLPPAPKAECSQTLQDKIIQVVHRMKNYNYSINEDIHRKKSFKNPSIYEKLIEVYKIDEFGSNFPSHIESLKSQGYMFYDELDQAQRAEWAKKEKEKKERTKIEMVSAVKKK